MAKARGDRGTFKDTSKLKDRLVLLSLFFVSTRLLCSMSLHLSKAVKCLSVCLSQLGNV